MLKVLVSNMILIPYLKDLKIACIYILNFFAF